MILRLAANAAVHTAGGVAMGVTAVLAACTVAQVAKIAYEETRRPRDPLGAPSATDPRPPSM